MKKILVTYISFGLMISSIMPCYAKSSFEISNKHMYSRYLEKLRITLDKETLIEKKEDMSQMLVDEKSDEFDTLFASIPLYNESFETIDTYQEANTNSLYYIEAFANQNEVLFVVNGKKYNIFTENEDIIMKSGNGDMLYLSKVEKIQDINLEKTESSMRASSLASYPYTSSDDQYFTKDAGPGSKTNKELVKGLSAISTIGGLPCAQVSSTIGQVLAVVGFGALIGDMVITTFYIKFWQAYKLSDSSYWREKQRWFNDSGYYNHIKNKTTYFYNSRPD